MTPTRTSLALLHFMARKLRGAPILLAATSREAEVRRSPSPSKLIHRFQASKILN